MKRPFLIYSSLGLVALSALLLLKFFSAPTESKETPKLHTAANSEISKVSQSKISRQSSWDLTQSPTSSSAHELKEQNVDSISTDSDHPDNHDQSPLTINQLLQKLQSPEFTREDAMAARKRMKETGADWDELKLFDRTWAANQPKEAIAYLKEIPKEEHLGYLRNMIPGLASESPLLAIALFESLEPMVQVKIRRSFYEGLIDNDVVVATDYIYESMDKKNYDWRPMDELARELIQDQGLESTLQWAEGLPKGALRHNAWSAAYAVWASRNPHQALESIMTLPKGSDRNLAINGMVSAHAQKDGERAVQWAAEITNPKLRKNAMIRVGRKYYAQDPLAATEWFDKSGLPQSAWEELTTQN